MRHEMLEIGGRGLTRFHQILKISRGPRNSTGFREVQRRATKFPGMPVPWYMISGLAWGGAPAILLLAFKCEGRPRRIYSGHPRSFPLGLLLAFLKQEFLCVPGVCIQGWYFPVSEDRVLADWVLFVWPCGVARDGFALRWRSVGIACVHSSRFNCNALRVLQFPFSIKGCQTNSIQMLLTRFQCSFV